jgi:hypothetical protein
MKSISNIMAVAALCSPALVLAQSASPLPSQAEADSQAMSCDRLAQEIRSEIGAMQGTRQAAAERDAKQQAAHDQVINSMIAAGTAQTILSNVPGGGIASTVIGAVQPNYDAKLRAMATKDIAAHQATPGKIIGNAQRIGALHEEFSKRCENNAAPKP